MPPFFCTNVCTRDGFGSQFQVIICVILYALKHKYQFVFTPVTSMEHNYEDDPAFCENINKFMNVTSRFENINAYHESIGVERHDAHIKYVMDDNINLFIIDSSLKFIREMFWENKDRNVFRNNKFNVVIHIRRPNSHDNRLTGADTPDLYYLTLIERIRQEHKDKDLQFHIHSQGNYSAFTQYTCHDTYIKLNLDLRDSFTEMVAADALVTSASSFSYIAGYLTEGIVYYMPFWHKPLPHWTVIQ